MKFIFSLAIKNLFRYYKRTIITSLSIALGIGFLIYIDGILKWADEDTVRNLKNYETASLKIANKNFFKDEELVPVAEIIPDKPKIISILKKEKINYTEEIKFIANLITEITGESFTFIGLGIEPAPHKNIYKLNRSIYKGKFLDNKNNSILISKYCAELLNVDIGDYIIVETRTRYNAYNADSFLITGIFDTPNPEINLNYFYIPISAADKLLDMEGNVNLLALKIENNIETVKKRLENQLTEAGINNIEIKSWKDMAKDYITLSKTKRGGSAFMLFLVFIIVAVGIINTMLMAVFERTGEIGMMRAMGATDKEILLCFIFESAGIGFIGGVVGVILGILINWYMIKYGWDFSSAMGDISYGYRVSAIWHTKWNPEMMGFAFIFAILISIIVSMFPARKAIKMNITDALKELRSTG